MADDVAIKVEHVSKTFKLPHEKQSSIKGALISIFNGGRSSYEKQEVLRDISFEVKKGEFFGIVGRNGSGKSTLLKMLAGIYVPTEGAIHINGKLTPFIELGVGFNPELTGRENVFLNGALLGFNRKEMEAMYDDIVAFAEIEKFMDQKLKNYSSGMQVRLAFSIAIRAESDILVLDEVLAVGDVSFQEKCFEVFKKIKRTGKTIVFVSHDLASVREFCDRAVLIDRGEQVEIGDVEKIVIDYEARMAADSNKTKGKPTVETNERPGSGEIVIDQVEVLNRSGKPSDSVEEGEDFTVQVKYAIKGSLKMAVCGLAINDRNGVSIIGPNTKEAAISLTKQKLEAANTISASFDTNVLAPGSYTLTVGLFDETGNHPYDYYSEALVFKVLGKARHGKTTIEPHWSLSNTTT